MKTPWFSKLNKTMPSQIDLDLGSVAKVDFRLRKIKLQTLLHRRSSIAIR